MWPSAKPSPLVPYGLGYQLQGMRASLELHARPLGRRHCLVPGGGPTWKKGFQGGGGRGRAEPLARQGCVERGILGVGSRRLPENQLGEFKRFKTVVALACCPASLV